MRGYWSNEYVNCWPTDLSKSDHTRDAEEKGAKEFGEVLLPTWSPTPSLLRQGLQTSVDCEYDTTVFETMDTGIIGFNLLN